MAGTDSTAILELDLRFFAKGAQALPSQKIEAVFALITKFVEEPADSSAEDEDEVPASMRRTVQKAVAVNDSDSPFVKSIKQAE